jgi:tetratricopeptide (TPR) repeat protein
VQGQLGEKLITDLIREIAQKKSSGLLRISRGKAIKAIFFESGIPTFAISNLTTEQLDHKLMKEGLATLEQIESAKQRAGKPHRLGPELVEMGVLEASQMRVLVREQVMGIVLSLFEWTQGDYSFDERIRADHAVALGLTVADVLLEGARRGADIPEVADKLAPHDGVVLRSKTAALRGDSGQLVPVESYILSRIESPINVSEVGALSGLADADAHRAVCALIAAGFLKLADQDEDEPESDVDNQLEHLREEVNRKLHFSPGSDYYDVLGVTRQATTAEIKAAYYQLAKKFHPDRYHHRDSGEMRNKLEALFGMITQAYETLSQPAQRAGYDEKIRRISGTLPKAPPLTAPVFERPPAEPTFAEARTPSADLTPASGPLATSTPVPQRPAEAPSGELAPQTRSGSQLPPAQMAEHYYQQGRARFERKEYHAAVHLLREAIKLDPSRAPYHYHLGIALIRNPRTRRDAEVHLFKAAELEPYNAQIRVKLGILYKEAGLSKKAEHFFREALQIDPENRAANREVSLGLRKSKADARSIWKSDVGTIAKKIFRK